MGGICRKGRGMLYRRSTAFGVRDGSCCISTLSKTFPKKISNRYQIFTILREQRLYFFFFYAMRPGKA